MTELEILIGEILDEFLTAYKIEKDNKNFKERELIEEYAHIIERYANKGESNK